MIKPFYIFLFLLLAGQPLHSEIVLADAFATEDVDRYIKRFKEIAIREMERTGVPASIKLAQGILESGAGKSDLARNAKNHFGIKCGSRWKGDEYYKKDDDYDDNGRLIKSCFRQYRNADASFVAHSEFLRDPSKAFRYGFLFRLDPTDYASWAKGLRQAGYATNPRYPELLISIIERNNLYLFDRPGAVDPEEVEAPIEEAIAGILRTNDVSYFISDAPMTVKEIARQVDVSVRRLLDYNEGLNKEEQEVAVGDRVYLQPKRSSFRGRDRYHTVQEGENLFDIAQRYGLRLDKLAKRNRLNEESDPATGTKIKLRGGKVKEAPREEGTPDPNAPIIDIPTNDDGNLDVIDPTNEPSDPSTTPPPFPTGPGVIIPGGYPPVPPTTTPGTTPNDENTGTPSIPNPVPAPTPETTPVTSRQYHDVVSGETLYGISRRYGLTVPELKALNQLTTNSIFIGQQLRIK